MQYNGYEIQVFESGCYVRNSKGDIIATTPTYDEAKEYIDDLNDTEEITKPQKDMYKMFVDYCKNMPGRCFLDGSREMSTIFETALIGHIKSFKKLHDVEIHYVPDIRANEIYYTVKSVE